MSPDLALAVLSLTKEVADIIRNGPEGHKELEDLNNRCIARLSSLQDLEASSMPLDDRTITRFLDETEMVLQGIITKLKSRRKLNFVLAVIKQDELQGWALEQNRKVDEQFRTMMMQILVTIGRQVMEMRARQEQDRDEILNEIRSQFGKISSRFQGEPSLDARLVDEALDLVTKQPVPYSPTLNPRPQSSRIHREPPSLPQLSPMDSLSFDVLPSPREPTIAEQSSSRIMPSQPPNTRTRQPAPCIVPPQPPDTPSIFRNDGKIYGNSLGLINHWLMTEDEHFKQVMLKTYLDHATSEMMLDIIEHRFEEARPETLRFVAQRAKLVDVIVAWLNATLPSEELVDRVRAFASGDVCALIPDHTTMILDAIKNRPRPPILPVRRGPTAEPQHPEELALALTHMEHDSHKTLRSIDYLWYARGLPSHVDTWLSNHHKMIRWVKYVVLRHDEIRDRAESMKRFIKAGQECLRRQNYNSLAAIARALDPTVNPMHDLVRTLEQLSRDKRAMLEDLTRIIDPDQNYKAYHKRTKKLRAANYIPWCIAELDAVNSHLSKYPSTVNELINFERYVQLGIKLPIYQVPPDSVGNRQERHIEYLREKVETEGYDDEGENKRRRLLKKREENDYRNRTTQWMDLGFGSGVSDHSRSNPAVTSTNVKDLQHEDSSRSGLNSEDTGVGMLNRNGAAGDVKTGTFFIYSPYDDRPETPVNSFTPKDLTCIQANLSIGGCLMSIHEPAEAASWMEDNWDNPLLTLIRNNGCGGPFAWMLSPTKPALVIFGCHNEPIVVNMVQSLANLSGFPVVIRPSDDNPALTLAHDPDPNVSVDFGGAVGNNDQRRHDVDIDEAMTDEGEHPPGESGNGGRRDDDHDDAESNGHGLNTAEEHKPNCSYKGAPGINRSGGGGGDDGGGGATTVNGKWESPLHRMRVKLHLKLNTAHTYTVTIGYNFKFIINREAEIPIDPNNLTRPLSQSEVIALVDLKIGTRLRETQVDRSYANIGFVSHRRESIIDHEFLHRGFDLPDKVYKHGQHRQNQRGIETNLGISQGVPLATAKISYNLNNDVTMEATDSKVMPRCRVDYETGDEWDKDNKSYFSYNIVYQVQDIRLDTERREFHPLEVKIGMGINLRPAGSKKPLPQISFINRNQVLIWVSDPTSKARIRGIMVLMSNHLDNIRTEEELSIYEQEEIELGTGSLNTPQTTAKMEEHKPGTISLSIVQVQNQGASGSNKQRAWVPASITKLVQRSSASPVVTCIPPHEYLARGWDANNNEWRAVLWPTLDKHFRAADVEGTAPVCRIQCPWRKAVRTSTGP